MTGTLRRRRSSRRTTALAGAAAAAVVGTLGALLLPGTGGDPVVPPGRPASQTGPPADEAPVSRLTITQAVVTLPGSTLADAVGQVSDALEPTSFDRTVRNLAQGLTTGPVRVDFHRQLGPGERRQVADALRALPRAEVVLQDVPGSALALVAPLSPAVRADLEATGALVPDLGPGPLSDALGGAYGVVPDEARRRVRVEYLGPALSDQALETARRELGRIAGVPVDQVRLEALRG